MPRIKYRFPARALSRAGVSLLLGAVLGMVLPGGLAVAQTLPVKPVARLLTNIQSRSLMITDPDVIGDKDRTTNPCSKTTPSLQAWGFIRLMTQVSAKDDTGTVEFTRKWLDLFKSPQFINDQTVGARNIDPILKAWEAWNWAPERAPFRLLAIVNRVDLLRSPLLAGENAGEVRFVFGAVDNSDVNKSCAPLDFSVIFEFGVRKSNCDDLLKWAQSWLGLQSIEPSDEAYRKALEKLTLAINVDSSRAKPNGSALDHVRTSEKLSGLVWQLREFIIDPGKNLLKQDTVTMSPYEGLLGSTELNNFLASIDSQIKAQDYWIPRRFPVSGEKLLGVVGIADTPWTPAGTFAQNTCGGCHITEKAGNPPSHVSPRDGSLSSFLRTTELQAREDFLTALAKDGCKMPAARLTFGKDNRPIRRPLVH